MKLISNDQSVIDSYNLWLDTQMGAARSCQFVEQYAQLDNASYLRLDYKHLRNIKTYRNLTNRIAEKPNDDVQVDVDKLLILRFVFDNNYGHVLHDLLPLLLHVDSTCEAEIVVAGTPMIVSLIDTLGMKLNRTRVLRSDEAVEYKLKNINTLDKVLAYRSTAYSTQLKQHIDVHLNNINITDRRDRLIYCTRNTSGDVHHGRLMQADNEQNIINVLREYANANNMCFTLFTGQENGKTMSHFKQMKLFREAKMVIGPHGSALANVIYLDPNNNPVVCEFCSGPGNLIHGAYPFKKNYNFLNSFALDDIYNYNIILFDDRSTPEITSIDVNDLNTLLTHHD